MYFVIGLNKNFQGISTKLLPYTVLFCLGILTLDAFAGHDHHVVTIENMQFAPSVLEVKRGDTIRWVNKDIFPHNAVADTGTFRSKVIAAEESWEWKADKLGETSYICTLHPTMKAKLIVR